MFEILLDVFCSMKNCREFFTVRAILVWQHSLFLLDQVRAVHSILCTVLVQSWLAAKVLEGSVRERIDPKAALDKRDREIRKVNVFT